MRDVAIVSFAQVRGDPTGGVPEVLMLVPAVREALERSGIPRCEIGFTCSGSADYLTGAPFAFVQNLAATGAVRALHHLELHHEIALVAFDHIEIADIVDPGITTVPQDADELGRRAAELLFDRIGGSLGPAVREVVPVQLVPRGSGELRAP